MNFEWFANCVSDLACKYEDWMCRLGSHTLTRLRWCTYCVVKAGPRDWEECRQELPVLPRYIVQTTTNPVRLRIAQMVLTRLVSAQDVWLRMSLGDGKCTGKVHRLNMTEDQSGHRLFNWEQAWGLGIVQVVLIRVDQCNHSNQCTEGNTLKRYRA